MRFNHLLLFCCLLLWGGCQPRAFTSLTPHQYQGLKEKEKGEVIDVRTPEEFATGHLTNAQNIDWRGGLFSQVIFSLDKNKTYFLYCATGNRSGQAMQKMKEAGFKKVYNIGGYKLLKEAGVETSEK